MLETICDNTKGKSLNLCLGLFRRLPIGKDPWQIHYFSDPTPVFLLFELNLKGHSRSLFHCSAFYTLPPKLQSARSPV